MRSGIYCIENLKNGKKYIGQSIDLEKRKKKHFWMLEKGCHANIHLQNSYNKYGKKNFKFRILLYCKPFELTRYEQFFVDFYISELLYNIRLECVDSNQGIAFSKEAREKISKASKRENLSKETRKKMSEAQSGKNHHMYGKHHSEEAKKKISNALSGENNPMYGKHLSEETKRKLSEANGGKNHPMYGKHHSEEAKRKLSEANSGEKGSNSKLKEKQVFEILDLYYNKGKTQIDIAKKFPVNNATISGVVRGKHWKSCYKKFMEKSEKRKEILWIKKK